MYNRNKKLWDIDARWNKEIDKRSEIDKGTYMPHEIEMTQEEFEAHKTTMSKKQKEKMKKGLPLYRGAKIKRLKKTFY